MKLILILAVVFVVTGCASSPKSKLYGDCQPVGNLPNGKALFHCEDL